MDSEKDYSKSVKMMQSEKSKTLSADVFFNKGADTTVRLSDNRILRFNKGALCCLAGSEVLNHIFFGELAVKETKIGDIDYDVFYLFLECVMGYKNINFDNSFKIFPVCHKYQCEDFIDVCMKFLKTKVMSERVCDLLNMAVLYSPQSDKLTEYIVTFVYLNNVNKFLENEKYCHLLEPDALKAILKRLNPKMIDSVLLTVLVNWGKNHIEKYLVNGVALKDFFQKQDLLKFFQLKNFETTGAISQFCSKEGKDIFSSEEVLHHFFSLTDLTHNISKWEKMVQNQSFTEQIFLLTVTTANGYNCYNYSYNYYLSLKVERNKAVFYNEHETGTEASLNLDAKALTDKSLFNEDGYFQAETKTKETFISCQIVVTDKGGGQCLNTNRTVLFSETDFEMILQNCVPPGRCPSGEMCCSLTWTFLKECRILLTNKPGDKLNDCGKMYFTKNISPCF